MRSTSLEAYNKIVPNLGQKQQRMLMKYMKYKQLAFTDYEMAKILGWPINTVTPRRGELAKLGLLVRDKRKMNHPSGCMANSWRIRL